jgi:predicted transcriptional regulator
MAERGRPAFKPTPALKRKVEELVSCGMSKDDVARALGISTPTLVKHFDEELSNGTAKKRAEVIGMLYKAAKGGNVTAQKKLEEMSRAAGAAESVKQRGEPKAPKTGKKEEQKAAAEAVGGIFAVPAAPKLVVDNR